MATENINPQCTCWLSNTSHNHCPIHNPPKVTRGNYGDTLSQQGAGIERRLKMAQEEQTLKYSVWAKILFFPFYSLWMGWCYLLGCKIEVKASNRKWKLK